MATALIPSRRAMLLLAGATALTSSGCAGTVPLDAQGALKRAINGPLYVGVAENLPWTRVADDGAVSGPEADLIRDYASGIGARIHWTRDAVSELARRMKDDQLDLVVGGLAADTPWSDKISPTRPYRTVRSADGTKQDLVIGVRPGENALQVSVERFLAKRTGEL